MIPARTLLMLLLGAMAGSGAMAQNVKLKPGLWEVQSTMKTGSGKLEAAMAQMQQQLASLPPAQRKQMEEMFKARGMSMPSPGGMQTVKICMTQKDVDIDNIPTCDGCTQKVSRTSANTLSLTYQCKGTAGDPPSSGTGTITIHDPGSYEGEHHIKTTMDGKPEQMDMTHKGRWLAADCGQIRPLREN